MMAAIQNEKEKADARQVLLLIHCYDFVKTKSVLFVIIIGVKILNNYQTVIILIIYLFYSEDFYFYFDNK